MLRKLKFFLHFHNMQPTVLRGDVIMLVCSYPECYESRIVPAFEDEAFTAAANDSLEAWLAAGPKRDPAKKPTIIRT